MTNDKYAQLRNYLLEQSAIDGCRNTSRPADRPLLPEIFLTPKEIDAQRRKENEINRTTQFMMDLGDYCGGRK